MSEQAVAAIREGFEALAESGVDGLIARGVVAPDFEFVTPPELASEPGTFRGPEGMRRYFDSWADAMEDVRFEPHAFHELGDKVAVELTVRARGRTTGIEVAQDAAMLWEFDAAGVARRAFTYRTLEDARAAA